MRGEARKRRLGGAGRVGGGGERRRGCSGEGWARGSGLGVARGRGAAKGGGYWGGAGLGWRLRGGVELAGVQAGRRRRSAAWERGERKRAVGIGFWGICRARALARRGRRPLQRALHRDGEVAAARALLDSAARVARPGSSSAMQQEGEELRGDAWVAAHGELMAGKAGKALHGGGGRRCRRRERKQSRGGGGGRKGSFCNYQKFQGLNCKPAISFKPKLKWKSAQHESCSTFQDLQL